MVVVLTKDPDTPNGRPELLPAFFEADQIVTPEDNPVYTPAMVADLVESMREHSQLVPGWVCPSPELPESKRLCIEGNRRLAAARLLGIRFWAFDLGRDVPEVERIKLTFQHNHSRRSMSSEEIAQRAARYMELTSCTAAEAAKHLLVSGPTLSRAFGERRIPAELKPRAERLGLSIRALVAAAPPGLMAQVIEFAEKDGADNRKPTRDHVALYIRHLKKGGKGKSRRPKTVTLRQSGRVVTLTVGEQDSANTVAEDLKSIVAKLGKHADVKPDGWPFLFQ